MYSEDDLGADSDYSVRSDAIDLLGEGGFDIGSDYNLRSDAFELLSDESGGEDTNSNYSIQSDALEMLGESDENNLELDSDYIAYSVMFLNPTPIAAVPTLLVVSEVCSGSCKSPSLTCTRVHVTCKGTYIYTRS